MPSRNPGFCREDVGEKVAEFRVIDGRMNIFYYIRRFWEISTVERVLLFKGILFSLTFYLIIKLLPLKLYFRILNPNNCNITDSIKTKKYYLLILKTMRRIRLILPWQNNCLVKSLVFKYLLNIFGIRSRISLSVNKNLNTIQSAHAFLKINNSFNYLKNNSHQEVSIF
jgi:hypothetical protein